MNKQEYMRNRLERKLYKATIMQDVFTEILLEDLIMTLDHATHTKKEINYYIKRMNSVRKQVANLKNELYFTCGSYKMKPKKTELLQYDTEADKLNEMVEEMHKTEINFDYIPF